MIEKQFEVNQLSELSLVVDFLLSLCEEGKKIFTLEGNLGAGKTTLVQLFCRNIKTTQLASSPTYSILNEYDIEDGKKIFHFDLYRMKSIEEVYDIGFEEYVYSNQICFIEWADIAYDILPSSTVNIKINQHLNKRLISVTYV